MVLNGINYTEKHLTDEEIAVVEAMRMGAKVDVNFFTSNYETMSDNFDSLRGNSFGYHRNADLAKFIYFETQSDRVKIGHYIDK